MFSDIFHLTSDIISLSSVSAAHFTTNNVLQFRQFAYDEYKFMRLYPDLYPRGFGHRAPRKRLRDTTVVQEKEDGEKKSGGRRASAFELKVL